jgi:hypothetical protein
MNLLSDVREPSLLVSACFVVLVLAVAGIAVWLVAAASRYAGEETSIVSARRRRAALVVGAWLIVTGAAAANGALASFERTPPPVMAVVALSAVMSTAFALSGAGRLVAHALPVSMLVGFHAFRLPLELILHRLGYEGVLPIQMTFDGMNFDIVTGASAVAVALWASTGSMPRAVLWLWNLVGLALLATIVTIAILSTPMPFRVFMNDPANTIITTFPWIWLPAVLVQAAWIGHLLLFRRLLARERAER